MKILHLTLTKKWFDRVGFDKWEEYRDSGKWILSRLYHPNGIPKTYDIIKFRNGYRQDSPVKTFRYEGFDFAIGNSDLGASGHHQYIIKFSSL